MSSVKYSMSSLLFFMFSHILDSISADTPWNIAFPDSYKVTIVSPVSA